MSFRIDAHCPSCGAVSEIRNPAVQQVTCSYCGTLFLWDKDGVKDLGIKSKLMPAISGLAIGTSGKLSGKSFVVMGRVQYAYAYQSGEEASRWDEWYLDLGNEESWISEDAGRLYLQVKANLTVPVKEEQVSVGTPLEVEGKSYRVKEVGTALCKGAEGCLPFKITPNESYLNVDALAEDGTNITLEFEDDEPLVFIGRLLTENDIQYKKEVSATSKKSTEALRCKNCGSPIAMAGNPSEIRTVGCSACGSVMTLDEGQQMILGKKNTGGAEVFQIPLGATGTLLETEWMVVGRLRNDWDVDGETGYELTYLLYNADKGYKWLSEEKFHYYLAEPLEFSKEFTYIGNYAPKTKFDILDKKFQFYEAGTMELTYVDGCLPWLARVGDRIEYADLTSPPLVFSEENVYDNGTLLEKEFFLSTYIEHETVKNAFGIEDLGVPYNVGLGQVQKPVPWEGLIKSGSIFASIVMLFLSIFLSGDGTPVLKETFSFAALNKKEVFTKPFQVKADETLEIKINSNLNNAWIGVFAGLYNADKQEMLTADDIAVEYYYGVEDGESWSEGNTTESLFWKVKDPGNYKLLLSVGESEHASSVNVNVDVSKGVKRVYPLVWLFFLWWIPPIFIWMRRWFFESSRWSDVMPEADDD
ncbi:MAG TPA: DUF4178 domain-containing protein [Leptospiraceae bacterium]|nr:DUF4178 domain-containing protein [Leptospiraceae bacterium]HNF12866.1 DUF4178 domain-containing protein [Leptospiraceae bacterium]